MRKKRTHSRTKYTDVQFACGAAVFSIAAAALMGWHLDLVYLKSIAPGFVAMNPLTALNFLLFSSWLLLRSRSRSFSSKHLAVIILLFNGFVLSPKLGEWFVTPDFVVDTIFFSSKVGTNRIAPSVVFNFLMLNVALGFTFTSYRNREHVFQGFVIASFVVSSVYLCGYLFDFSSLIGASVIMPMALNTCISYLVLCLGLLLVYPDKGFMRPILSKKLGGKMARRILPLLIVIPVITGALRIWGQSLKLYNTELGVAIHVVTIAFLSLILSYYFARKLNEIDALRKEHENELEEKGKLLQRSEYMLSQTASIAKVGGWEIDLKTNEIVYTKEFRAIREIDEDQSIAFSDFFNAYTPEYINQAFELYNQAVTKKTAYELEAKLVTAKQREIWVKLKGYPVLSEDDEVVAVKGTLQDVDEEKKKELLLEDSSRIINEQNKQLMNFTHIVSHNLRTHAANIKSILSLYQDEENEQEKALILQMMNRATESLSQTIIDLNEIVATQSASAQLKSVLYFEDVFEIARGVLEPEIRASQAIIQTDFSACEKMEYVPAYLESIFHNFLSNALKYRRPDVRPEIKISTTIENGRVTMSFADNGLGIDLSKYKEMLFGMYKTFHHHPDATGVGLFITKNQVEALGGNILVDSEVNIGTTFRIIF